MKKFLLGLLRDVVMVVISATIGALTVNLFRYCELMGIFVIVMLSYMSVDCLRMYLMKCLDSKNKEENENDR